MNRKLRLIAFYGYERARVLSKYRDDYALVPRFMLHELEEKLSIMAGYDYRDNKTTIVFEDILTANKYIVTFYDSTCSLVEFYGEDDMHKTYLRFREAHIAE